MSALSLKAQTVSYRVPRDKHLSVADYSKSLPNPPVGYYWKRCDDRTWDLSAFERDLAEPDSVTFQKPSNLVHVVMPNDTLQGLCLRYRVSATELKRFNLISGNNVQVLKEVKIPISHNEPVTIQAEDRDVTLQRFKNATGESREEALVYLEDHDFNLDAALLAWRADESWQKAAGPALAASVIQDLNLSPEEAALEAAQRQLPEHGVVFPTRIVFVDSEAEVRVVAPYLVRSEFPGAASPPEPSAPPAPGIGHRASLRLEQLGEAYEPLLASPYGDHDDL